jgi:hypothetical protein
MILVFDYDSFVGLTDTLFNHPGDSHMATKAQLAAAKKATAKSAAPKAAAAKAPAAAVAGTAGPDMALLGTIVNATRSEAGFTYADKTDALAALVAALYVEVREDIVDPTNANAIAARSTDLGNSTHDAAQAQAAAPAASPFGASASAAFTPTAPVAPFAAAPVAPAAVTAAVTAAAPAVAAAAVASAFTLLANVPIPAAKRFGKSSTYPFDSMEPGQAFFVPATAERPNPAKSMASTVNSAKARYAVQDGVEADGVTPKFKNTREFVLRRVLDGKDFGHPGVEGAGIWRSK